MRTLLLDRKSQLWLLYHFSNHLYTIWLCFIWDNGWYISVPFPLFCIAYRWSFSCIHFLDHYLGSINHDVHKSQYFWVTARIPTSWTLHPIRIFVAPPVAVSKCFFHRSLLSSVIPRFLTSDPHPKILLLDDNFLMAERFPLRVNVISVVLIGLMFSPTEKNHWSIILRPSLVDPLLPSAEVSETPIPL